MSNTCACPNPPGGTIECADDQLAVCGYQNGQIVSGCYGRPSHVFHIEDEGDKHLALGNWIISIVTGAVRSDSDPIGSEHFAMLSEGRYTNERTGAVIRFAPPSDFELQNIARSRPLLRTR